MNDTINQQSLDREVFFFRNLAECLAQKMLVAKDFNALIGLFNIAGATEDVIDNGFSPLEDKLLQSIEFMGKEITDYRNNAITNDPAITTVLEIINDINHVLLENQYRFEDAIFDGTPVDVVVAKCKSKLQEVINNSRETLAQLAQEERDVNTILEDSSQFKNLTTMLKNLISGVGVAQ